MFLVNHFCNWTYTLTVAKQRSGTFGDALYHKSVFYLWNVKFCSLSTFLHSDFMSPCCNILF